MESKVLYWSPRVLGILAILFMMMFSMDCFGEYDSFGKQMTCFFMHNIPAMICLAALVIAWKWQMIGGILFALIFIAASIFFGSFRSNPYSLIVISPFLIVAILFILSDQKGKNKQ